MGYSITHEQHQRLERLKAEGRDCKMSTRGGGCFNRATRKATQQSFPYKLDEGNESTHVMTLCTRHVYPVGYEGVNFRVTKVEKY